MGKKQGEEAEELVVETSETEEVVDAPELTEEQQATLDAEKEADLAWMQDEEPDSSEEVDGVVADPDAGKGVSVAKHVAIKQKLKKKLRGKDDELEEAKARIKELEEAGKQPPESLDKPVRPRRAAFETDEEHEDALDAHDVRMSEYIPKVAAVDADQTARVAARVKTVNDAVDKHLDRAAKLIDTSGVDPDVYQSAQDNVKRVIGEVKPGGEEFVFNEFIERLGEGSEKVMFHVGNRKTQLHEFERLLRSDPSGISAAMFLAEKKREIAGSKTLSSRAPKPAANLKGGEAPKANATAAQKKYDAAHKKGQNQEAFNIKRQAKAGGVDVSSW